MNNVHIVYVIVDKYDYAGGFYRMHGNGLYEAVLRELLAEAFAAVKGGDANVFLDRSSFVTLSSFRTIAGEIAASVGCNLKKCDKVTSHQTDMCRSRLCGRGDQPQLRGWRSTLLDVIRERISIAHKD